MVASDAPGDTADVPLDASIKTLALHHRSDARESAAVSSQPTRDDHVAEVNEHDEPAHALFKLKAQVEPEPPAWDTFQIQYQRDATQKYSQITHPALRKNLLILDSLFDLVEHHPYSLLLYNATAQVYLRLGYPDLATGAAYKALLLVDAVHEDSDEYHEVATADLRRAVERDQQNVANDEDVTAWLDLHCRPVIYQLLAKTLLLCDCLQSAALYATQGLQYLPEDSELRSINALVVEKAANHFDVTQQQLLAGEHKNPTTWPDTGMVRRECYPWNTHEPNRLNDVDKLNDMLQSVAPKLEVKAVDLPALASTLDSTTPSVVTQLGVFAKEDIQPGEVALNETSLLTANNKLQDALCDACSADLPELDSEAGQSIVACEMCEVVFCSNTCYDLAMQSYHPSLCERDVEAIAKDVSPTQASDSLYSLLLLRALAMAETQDSHPADLNEVKYIWGDFHALHLNTHFQQPSSKDEASAFAGFPRTLPFSFEYNVRLPLHMLEKMDIDIFANPKYDVWVFNTLYAKFRGTASARLSGLGGRAIRGPEVCAVHPMWCLANHSCDPNVSWEWGGSIKFHVREERAFWQGADTRTTMRTPGIRKGEEVLNHYCDLDLPVQERREWARGALGGDCMCERCVWEAAQQAQI